MGGQVHPQLFSVAGPEKGAELEQTAGEGAVAGDFSVMTNERTCQCMLGRSWGEVGDKVTRWVPAVPWGDQPSELQQGYLSTATHRLADQGGAMRAPIPGLPCPPLAPG